MALNDPDYQAFPYVYGTIPTHHSDMTVALREAARATLRDFAGKPLRYLEIGIWEGRSGCWMLDNVLTHPDSQYLGIDNWKDMDRSPYDQVLISARRHLGYHGGKVVILSGDSKLIVPVLEGPFDIIFVDGSHEYGDCYADLCNVWPKLVTGGILICDDYSYPNLPGVPKAVDQWLSEHPEARLLHKAQAIAFRKDST